MILNEIVGMTLQEERAHMGSGAKVFRQIWFGYNLASAERRYIGARRSDMNQFTDVD